LQVITHFKTPRINKMCKNKWNCIHGDYKQIFDYHKGTKDVKSEYNENCYNDWGLINWLILKLFELDITLEPLHVNHFNSIWPYELVNISILHTWMCICYHNKSKHKIIFNIFHLQSTYVHDLSFMILLIYNVAWNELSVATLVTYSWDYGNDNHIKFYFEFNISSFQQGHM
jgi:hypothetical protein